MAVAIIDEFHNNDSLNSGENARIRVIWLLEQWGLWVRLGEPNKSPRTPLMGLYTKSLVSLAIDDDTAMMVDRAMCECAKHYPKGHAIIKAYYVKGHTNRRIQRDLQMSEPTLLRHKSNAIAYLVGVLAGAKIF